MDVVELMDFSLCRCHCHRCYYQPIVFAVLFDLPYEGKIRWQCLRVSMNVPDFFGMIYLLWPLIWNANTSAHRIFEIIVLSVARKFLWV